MFDGVVLAFKTITAIINLIPIITIFNKIYKTIFDYFFVAKSSENGFFRSMSTYF